MRLSLSAVCRLDRGRWGRSVWHVRDGCGAQAVAGSKGVAVIGRDHLASVWDEVHRLEAENVRLREALEWAAIQLDAATFHEDAREARAALTRNTPSTTEGAT
jgi:hypothetical protein